jgi:hypothetical protein
MWTDPMGEGRVTGEQRKVKLRHGEDGRYLWAFLDGRGNLRINGEDYGPKIALVTTNDSYEWVDKVAAKDIPRLCELLGGQPDDDVLDLLEDWKGPRADDLERLLRESDLDIDVWVR